jgi:hypothetical protein
MLRQSTVLAFALALATAGMGAAAANAAPQDGQHNRDQYGYGGNRGDWDTPPQGLSDAQRRGFRDGIEGARKDFGNHRNPNPENRDEYRHPGVPRGQWEAYRYGFRMGYQRGMNYLAGGPQQPYPGPAYQPPAYQPPADQGPGPAGMPGLEDRGQGYGPNGGIELQGVQDGMEGALRDLGNHRPPDVENRDEYRHPPVPYPQRDAYRDGFRRGYRWCVAALTGEMGGGRGMGPGAEFRRHGFEDGVEGALKDFGNRRRPDVENRDEYRHPDVPYGQREAYRDSFRRGYDRATDELNGESGRR